MVLENSEYLIVSVLINPEKNMFRMIEREMVVHVFVVGFLKIDRASGEGMMV